jgi:hypothetical protein
MDLIAKLLKTSNYTWQMFSKSLGIKRHSTASIGRAVNSILNQKHLINDFDYVHENFFAEELR